MIAGRRATEERVYSDNLVIESQDERSVLHSCQAQSQSQSTLGERFGPEPDYSGGEIWP